MPTLQQAIFVLIQPFSMIVKFLLTVEVFGISFGGLLVTALVCDLIVFVFLNPVHRVRVNPNSPNDTKRLGSGDTK